ncbi:hypothetical protein BEK98_08665 [Streptomyces diastatochromogenes]|uniref:Uncharacterized protein n=1 Tax=Streptomyces diastatochromogenes TaxID=42236 RepID=A0A233SPU2_STRDA|nr:hypothetical protein BEK98_08665 [Streptomyces diastatochromogenes]
MASRGWTRWGLFALVGALPVLVLGWLAVVVVRFATSDYPLGGGPEKVPCAEALDFGGAKLPEGAYDTECTVQAWMDTDYEATFRMPRAGVRDWLTGTYPKGPAPGTELCDESADLCLNLDSDEHAPPAGVDANAVVVNVTYEGPDTARVSFSAFTV